MNLSFVKLGDWSKAESQLAKRFGLSLYPAEGRMYELIEEEVAFSDFTSADILHEFESSPHSILDFGARWYADCKNIDYGEEWDPEEGNQQEDAPLGSVVGIGQGFLVGYTLLYLYSKHHPDKLAGFIKRRKIPHAKQVAKDVLRIYETVNRQND